MKISGVLATLLRSASLVVLAGHLASGRPSKPCPPKFPSLLDATLDQLRLGLDSGIFTSVDLVTAYLARINETNHDLRAVLEINPDALDIARHIDAKRASGNFSYGPLHGIPILLKDNIATDDEMNNTAGSYALLGAKVAGDSTIARKLRDSGVIFLGKTNMDEWASGRSRNVSSGWSARGGQTLGAYSPYQNPGGSSSGSAVGSSIGLAWATLGTETGGSIIFPANNNNIVGIKPTVGLTSRHLVVPYSEHQDTIGPLARTVKDAAHLLSVIAGPDPNDNYTSAIPFAKIPDYVGACKDSGLQGKRLGIPRDLIQIFPGDNATTPTDRAAFEDALDILRSAGAEIVDDIKLPGLEWFTTNSSGAAIAADVYTNIPGYFKGLKTNPNNITTLEGLRNYTRNSPVEDYPRVDTLVWDGAIEGGLSNNSPEAWKARTDTIYHIGLLGLTGALKNHSLDALVMPSMSSILLPAALGTPIVSIPLGKLPSNSTTVTSPLGPNMSGPNLPFGIGFLGAAFSEEVLIEIAYAFEQRTKVRETVKPLLKPKTELVDVVSGAKDVESRL